MLSKALTGAALLTVLGTGGQRSPKPPESQPVRIAGGSFRLGTARADVPGLKRRYGVSFPGVFDNELPQHVVTLHDFSIDPTEVTNAQFARFVEEKPEWRRDRLPSSLQNGHYLEAWPAGVPPADQADHPVAFVTWHAAQAFCRWTGGRLPTEAEWEYAARSRQSAEFPWGDDPPTPLRANYARSARHATVPVRSYPPNSAGLHDLAGNVWEFTLDAWRPTYPGQPEVDPVGGGPVADDQLLTIVGRRAIRGGSYDGAEVNLRTRWRDSHPVTNAVAYVGFRCAYQIDP